MDAVVDEAQLRAAAHQDSDWLVSWQEMVDAEHAQSDRIAQTTRASGEDWWAGQASRFAAFAQRTPQPDAFLRTVLPHLRPDDHVLDIGAGTGRHTTYLATQAAQVVAVEPSAGMRAQLAQRLAAEQLHNVSVVADTWPSAAVPPGDLAIAAHVVYAVRAIGPFLQAMDAAARRACFLAVGIHQPSFVTAPFWERVYGEARLPLPGVVECLGALAQLGIIAEITLLPTTPYRFADADEALADLRWRLQVTPGSSQDAALRQAIADLLVDDDTSGLITRAPALPTVVLWWTK